MSEEPKALVPLEEKQVDFYGDDITAAPWKLITWKNLKFTFHSGHYVITSVRDRCETGPF
jgi:hypothetical protein